MTRFIDGLVLFTCMAVLINGGVTAPKEFETVLDRIIAANEKVNEERLDRATDPTKDPATNNAINNTNEVKLLDLYQGDIVLDQETKNLLAAPRNNKFKRNAVRKRLYLWLSRVIPYTVPYHMNYIKPNLKIAIDEYHKYTCLRFVPYSGQSNWITFGQHDGCSSRIGRKHYPPGPQTVSIAKYCNTPGTIIHELLHALGFWHEQSRSDRDKYVKVNFENIKDGMESQFQKYSWRDLDDLGLDYDYQSIMHYSRTAFSKNGRATLQAINDPNMKFGNARDRLSTKDIIEINALYNCKSTSYGWTSWSRFTPCDGNCKKSRQRYCYHNGDVTMCGGNTNAYGIETQQATCSNCPEPTDGHWSNWGAWSTCSATCDEGLHKRTRLCDNPPPANKGSLCAGSGSEVAFCILKRCHLDTDDTDFESGMGRWSNQQGDDFDWTRNQGHTATIKTGPMADHTSGKGFYMYIESSSPRYSGDKARLATPWLPYVAGGQCIKFAYSMYGKSTGKLTLSLEVYDRDTKYLLFYKKGDQGEGWKTDQGNIDVPPYVKYRLIFEASIGSTVGYSDIAIDDVYIDPGLCSCQDKYQICKRWASNGECTKNADYMSKNCRRSCHACAIPTTMKVLSTTMALSTPVPTVPCDRQDIDSTQCPLWAKRGECTKSSSWMEINCPKSCKLCSCTDSDPNQCPLWAAHGYCKTNPDYMLVKCVKSCHVCVCHDTNVGCRTWANQGDCQSNPAYMLPNCKRSCKQCL